MNRLTPILTLSHAATSIHWTASGDDLLVIAGVAWSALMFFGFLRNRARGETEFA